jgi:hypothetical protein
VRSSGEIFPDESMIDSVRNPLAKWASGCFDLTGNTVAVRMATTGTSKMPEILEIIEAEETAVKVKKIVKKS